jgi:hypothetical protein
LLCLVALNQYIDENPWGGFRFGALHLRRPLRGAVWENRAWISLLVLDLPCLPVTAGIASRQREALWYGTMKVTLVRLSFRIDTGERLKVTTAEFESGILNL